VSTPVEGGLCDRCGVNPAAIHLTQIEGAQSRTRNLCESCAAELGLNPGTPLGTAPLADFLAKMGQAIPASEGGPTAGTCPGCGLTLADFKRTGRLGCARCWGAFEVSLRGLLRKLHGGTQHAGKAYLPAGAAQPDRPQRIASLRRALQHAVEGEDFERAAALRDQIRRMEAD
jgi:protein arginine kinase activator